MILQSVSRCTSGLVDSVETPSNEKTSGGRWRWLSSEPEITRGYKSLNRPQRCPQLSPTRGVHHDIHHDHHDS